MVAISLKQVDLIVEEAVSEIGRMGRYYPDLVYQESDVRYHLFREIQGLLERGRLFGHGKVVVHTETQSRKGLYDIALYKREAFNKNLSVAPLAVIKVRANNPVQKRPDASNPSFKHNINRAKSDYKMLKSSNVPLNYLLFVDLEDISCEEGHNRRMHFFDKMPNLGYKNHYIRRKGIVCYYIRFSESSLIKATCTKCWKRKLKMGEYVLAGCEHDDKDKIDQWIENHKKVCNGRINIRKIR
ncbi:MAG: hypothetical protein NT001_06170 [Candidatus Woesearchaeota archaeon]|nr:hypothetical protein [Candidatus Woesearchaeota archaeon]